MSLKLDRRDFLQFTAGGALGLATSGVTLRGISDLNAALDAEEVRVPHGPERWSNSICWLCPAGCGLRVRTVGDRVVKIKGNPLHPANQGGLCPKGIAGLQDLYHPDRLRVPLKNSGTRESPRWQEVSWDEAAGLLVRQLKRLQVQGTPHGFVVIDRSAGSQRSRLLRRFLSAYGSPNYLTLPSGLDAVQAAVFLQQGVSGPVAYDLENSRYVLSCGVNLLEGWTSPASMSRVFGRWRDASAGRRTKFVQADSRFSPTAAKADEWIPMRPGTEAALALGIAYVLISERLYDSRFVNERTFGFEDWQDANGKSHIGFRSLVLNEYRLNAVSEFTGVPPDSILRVAREFAGNRPAVAIGDSQLSTVAGNPCAAMAVHSLNALVGGIGAAGGVLIQAQLPLSESSEAGEIQQPRVDQTPQHLFPGHHISRLPAAILESSPYPVEVLALHDVNPVFSQPNGERFRKAFKKVPFIVSWTAFMNESSSLADVVLPVPTGLERWQDAESPAGFPYALQAISPPVISPQHGVRDSADVVLDVAAALGGKVASALPFGNMEQYLSDRLRTLFEAQTGSVFAPRLEQAWDRLLESSGWWAPTYSTADELREQVYEHGGWWEPTYYYGEWDRLCQTPSGRFEFFSQGLAAWAKKHPDFARAAGRTAGDDHLFLPGQPQLEETPQEFPLQLIVVEVLPLSGGEGGHLPYLQQIAGEHLFAHWGSWLEINPHTAERRGISDGDEVWVESPQGRIRARARLYAGARPDTVYMPLGYGRTEGSEWSCRGSNPLQLLEEKYEPLAGLPEGRTAFVKVYRS